MRSNYCGCANAVMKGLDTAPVTTQTVISWVTTSQKFLSYQGLAEVHTLLLWYFAETEMVNKEFKDNEQQS